MSEMFVPGGFRFGRKRTEGGEADGRREGRLWGLTVVQQKDDAPVKEAHVPLPGDL